jgi:hypothetical protein
MGKNIYIVLSRSSTILSRIIHALTGEEFTHAAIALDVELDYMFSFGRRWRRNPFVGCFKRERLDDKMYSAGRSLPGVIIEVPVTEEQYGDIAGRIDEFRRNSAMFSYNVPGLITGIWGGTWESGKRFFCSEFVYYVLSESGVCDFGMTRGECRPQTLMRLDGRIVFNGNLQGYALWREPAHAR